MNDSAMHRVLGFAAGLLAFAAAHEVEVLRWAAWFEGAHEPWFLNSGRAVAFTLAFLFVTGLISGWFRLSGLMLAAGAATAMTMVMFFKEGGPGTIFPIVIVVGAGLIVATSILGVWVGREICGVARLH